MSLDPVRALLAGMRDDERRAVLKVLREEFGVVLHPLETAWGTTAEVILEAIHAAPDLTQRGVRGVLAEAIFRTSVAPTLQGWTSIDFAGDLPYDLLLDNGATQLKVQVKNQRRERGEPKIDARLSELHGFPVYVAETQRTRTGQVTGPDGETTATRPYRFGEFDLLAVCMQPSTGTWTDFIYCPTHLLLPRPQDPQLLNVLQPIYTNGTHGWSCDFEAAAAVAVAHLLGH